MFYSLLFIVVSFTTFQSALVLGAKSCGNSADVAFIIDDSRSIQKNEFVQQIKFVEEMASSFDIGPNKTQIAAITFSDGVRREFTLNQYTDKDSVVTAIKNIHNNHGGSTDTDKALKYVRDVIFTAENGARPNVPHIVIFTTDGRPTNPWVIEAVSQTVRDKNIRVFALGIGNVNIKVLNQIAYEPTEQYVTKVEHFDNLTSIKDNLALRACQALTTLPPPTTTEPTTTTTTTEPTTTTTEPPTTTEEQMQGDRPDSGCVTGKNSDIIFVLDKSSSINYTDFGQQLEFVNEVISEFNIGPLKTQIGILTFSDNPKIEFFLNQYSRKNDLMDAVRKIRYTGGNTYTNLALEMVRKKMLSRRAGARPGVAKIVVVITDGVSRLPELTAKEAAMIKDEDVYMFAIGVGNDVDKGELQSIGSSPASSFVYAVSGYRALKEIKSLLSMTNCKDTQNDKLTPCGSKDPADVIFVSDFSSATYSNVFGIMETIGNVAQGLDISKSGVRVGLASSPCPDVNDVNPLLYNDAISFSRAIRPTADLRVSQLLMKAKAMLTARYSRPNAKRVIVLHTSGIGDDLKTTAREIMRLMHPTVGVKVIVVSGNEDSDKMVARLPSNAKVFYKGVGMDQTILNRICDQIRV